MASKVEPWSSTKEQKTLLSIKVLSSRCHTPTNDNKMLGISQNGKDVYRSGVSTNSSLPFLHHSRVERVLLPPMLRYTLVRTWAFRLIEVIAKHGIMTSSWEDLWICR